MIKGISGATIATWMAGCSAILMLTGCSAVKAYPGPALPDSAVARLHGYFRYYVLAIDEVKILKVDGQAHGAYEAVVTPGRHTFMTEAGGMFLGAVGFRRCAFELEVEAGHDYYLVPNTYKAIPGTLKKIPGPFPGSTLLASRDVEVRFAERSLGRQTISLQCWL